MANMRMATKSSRPICSRGIMAFMMDLSTTCRPGGQRTERVQVGSVGAQHVSHVVCSSGWVRIQDIKLYIFRAKLFHVSICRCSLFIKNKKKVCSYYLLLHLLMLLFTLFFLNDYLSLSFVDTFLKNVISCS